MFVSAVVAISIFPATVSLAAVTSDIEDKYQLSLIALAVTYLASSVHVSTSAHVALLIVSCLASTAVLTAFCVG